jgi:hypothetical protein
MLPLSQPPGEVSLRLTPKVLELALHQRVKPGCRLVEHQQFRPVHESQHQPGLLAVPFRQFTDRAVDHYLERVEQMPGERVVIEAA